MAKPAKKRSAPSVQPVAVPVAKPEASWVRYYPYAVTGLFFILSFIGILRHEMWRDEYQAWMVAADADSIPQLFQNLKYEGNPVLWHAFLFIISSITEDPFWMQVFHIIISTSFIFLINRYAPFSILQKFLLTFGYYTFYEYNIISRGYGLGFLLIVIFCILFEQRKKYILWISAVLFLLANTTIFGVMLAVCFAGILFLERLFFIDRKSKTPPVTYGKLFLSLGIVAAGVILGYMQIRPEPDNSFPTFYVTDVDIIRAKWAFSRLIHAYFPIPDFTTFHFWNKNLFVPDESRFLIGITPLLFLLWIIAFLRFRLILILYSLGTLLLIAFYYYTGFIWARYAGHLFLLLVACHWLAHFYKEQPFQQSIMNRLSLAGNKIRVPYFLIILFISLIGGVWSYAKDLEHPFSTSEKAAAFIKEKGLQHLDIIGSRDYIISPLATQLGRKIIYAERREPGSFIIYDQKRTNIWAFKEVQATIEDMNRQGLKQILLVKDLPLKMTFNDTGETVPWINDLLTERLNMQLLATIEPGIVHDEVYYIYLIQEITQ